MNKLIYANCNLKHVAINFKLPNKAVSKTLQSIVKLIHIKHRYNLFNQHLAQKYMINTTVQNKNHKDKLNYSFSSTSLFLGRDRVFRWPRQSSILPVLTIASGNYHQFHHTKRLLKI